MRPRRLLVLLLVAASAAGCMRRQAPSPYAQAYPASAPVYAAPAMGYEAPYTLDAGDRLRVTVFGQEGLSNSYVVDAAGNVNLSLTGPVPARGLTTEQLAQSLGERLRAGFVRDPHVSVEVEAYRPFFILGEVTAPGQYPYVANMTVETAVAIAGGYSPRAEKKSMQMTRVINGQSIRAKVPPNAPVRPGDTITIPERWF